MRGEAPCPHRRQINTKVAAAGEWNVSVHAGLRLPHDSMPMKKTPPPSPLSGDWMAGYPSLHWSRETGWSSVPESLAVEAPLAIEIAYGRLGQDVRKVLAVTMRTPGNDEELALGFLFAEGLISGLEDVVASRAAEENSRGETIATQAIQLCHPPREDLQRVSRGLITSSACGMCGRTTLQGLSFAPPLRPTEGTLLSAEAIAALPDLLRPGQAAFTATGGSHGAGLFDAGGHLIFVREDVGRHNAVDKVIGAALRAKIVLAGKILVLSGRVSFELMQKAAVAGVAVVVAVGAPSSLAVNLAQTAGITLIGFTRGPRFNVYTHAGRLDPGRPVERPAPPA